MRYTKGYTNVLLKGYTNDKTDGKQIDGYPFIKYPFIPSHSPILTRHRAFHKRSTHEIPNDHNVVVKSGEWIPKWIPKGHNHRYNQGDVLIYIIRR